MKLKRIGSLGRPVYAHVLGDMTQASAPIRIRYTVREHEVTTCYQTADARHNSVAAVRLAREWESSQY